MRQQSPPDSVAVRAPPPDESKLHNLNSDLGRRVSPLKIAPILWRTVFRRRGRRWEV